MRRISAKPGPMSIRLTIACASPDCSFSTTTLACCTSMIERTSAGITSSSVVPRSITTAAFVELPFSLTRTRRKMPNVSVTRIAPRRMAVMNGQMMRNAAYSSSSASSPKKITPVRRHWGLCSMGLSTGSLGCSITGTSLE